MDNFGVWTPSSIEVLRSIARSSTVRNGLFVAIAFHHLVEWLSVQLYRYNARMVLHFWALHPHLEHDWLDACTRWEVGCSQLHQSHDDNEDEDQEGSGSTSPLNDSGASVLSEVSYGVDVCNRFACLPIEPTPDDCAVPTVMSDCSDSSCVNSSCLTPQLSPAISLSSNSRIPGSHGSHPAGLLVSKAASGGNLSLFQGISSPASTDKEPSPSSSSLPSDDASSGVCETVAPPDGLKNLICFTFNNLSSCNLSSMVEQFSDSVRDIYFPWVAVYLVERASTEPNLHTLYLLF